MHKVVHIAKAVGGVGVYIALSTKHLDRSKFESVLICNDEDTNTPIFDQSANEIKKYNLNITREINPANDTSALYTLIKQLREIKPDIIHCHSAKAGVLGRMAGIILGIPTVYTPHAFSYLSADSKKKSTVFKLIEKYFSHFPSNILACSFSESTRAIKDLNYPSSKVFTWENSINDIKEEDLLPTDISLPDQYICSIGRPSYQKNTEMLISAIYEIKKIIPDIHLVLLGIGHYSPTLENIKTLIQTLGVEKNITLIPWLKREETMTIVKNSQLYVSSSRYEGLPYSIVEALCLGKPCVVTNVDGNNDLIKDGHNGYLINESATQMALKTINILTDSALKERLSKNARTTFLEKYDIVQNITKLEQLYLLLITKETS